MKEKNLLRKECKYFKEDLKNDKCKILNELLCRKSEKCSFYKPKEGKKQNGR